MVPKISSNKHNIKANSKIYNKIDLHLKFS